MNKLISLLVLTLLPFFANSTDYQEGEHYVKVKNIAVEAPEVREYFSFYCGHCFNFEPMAKSIESNLPAGTSFEKNHVDFLRGASRKVQQLLTRALITAQAMGIAESQTAAIFKYIHVHRGVFISIKDVRNVFVLNGVDGAKFDDLMASESVNAQAEKMKSNQDILATSGDLKSVPSVVVNGKYMIDVHGLNKDNIEQDYNNLVKYLLTLD